MSQETLSEADKRHLDARENDEIENGLVYRRLSPEAEAKNQKEIAEAAAREAAALADTSRSL
jgi:hypothetical protein